MQNGAGGCRRWLAVLALSAAPLPVLAQPAPAQRLEDLIPDSAVANPEAWANQTEAATNAPQDNAQAATLDVEAPLAEVPDLTLPWPDEVELAKPEPLAAEPEAALAAEAFEPFNRVRRGKEERLSSHLLLVFPRDDAEFPERKAFAERFETLSNIESLADDDDNLAQIAARAREDEELLEQLLRTYGYYDGRVMRSVKGLEEGQTPRSPMSASILFRANSTSSGRSISAT